MGFENKNQMKNIVRRELKAKLDIRHVVEDFPFGSDSADLVFLTVSDEVLETRVAKLGINTPILNATRLGVFILLRGEGEVSRSKFYNTGNMRKSTKKAAVRWLEQEGFVEETPDRKIRVHPELGRHVTSAAMQLHPDDWKIGLRRADSCDEFSEYQFLVINEEDLEEAASQSDYFSGLNVGLVSVADNGECKFHHSPNRSDPASPLHAWRINEINMREILKKRGEYDKEDEQEVSASEWD